MRHAWMGGCLWLAAIGAIAACGRADTPARTESGAIPSPSPARRNDAPPWVTELGPLLVVPGDSESSAIVISPETAGDREMASPVTLLNAAGDTIARSVTLVPSDSALCGAAIARVAGPAKTGWAVGLRSAVAFPLRADSIDGLATADSAQRAANLARLASTVAAASESRFRGLPFNVLTARGVNWKGGRIVFAHLVRRLNQEASPFEEHTFVIGERAPGEAITSPLKLAFSERSDGTEESADHFEVLSIIETQQSVLVILSRENLSRTQYEILSRSPAGTWQLRWARVVSC